MTNRTKRLIASNDLSLRSLELFQICAQEGSLQNTATKTGLSISTISNHLRKLEDHLGVALFDHSRRPMILTPTGQGFLDNIQNPLIAIRRAKADLSSGQLHETRRLNIGAIDDFDSDVMPELGVYLSQKLPACHFIYHTDSSHSIVAMMRNRELDLGIIADPDDALKDFKRHPILKDPFVIITPRFMDHKIDEIFAGKTNLPFLRFSNNLIIGRQIATHLRRIGLAPPSTFECSNNQMLMAMVASGAGWTITTALHYLRATNFQAQVKVQPIPDKGFSRRITTIATPDCSDPVFHLVNQKLRLLIEQRVLAPIHKTAPWLAQNFILID